MRDTLPSVTALIVAAARGIGGLNRSGPARDLDPTARELLPRPLGSVLGALERATRDRPAVERGLRAASLGLVDHLVWRTLAIDRAIERAVEGGVGQLVILGAGLDGRAHRLRSLRDVRVFEVDHPSTHGYKVERVRHLADPNPNVEYVAVHFERERLSEGLARSSHDPKVPTFFVWEGVTMYLAPEALTETLRDVAAASAPASLLAATYATPERVTARQLIGPIANIVFRSLGEPLRGLMSKDEFHRLLRPAGFEPIDDQDEDDWVRSVGYDRISLLKIAERLVIASRV